MENRKRNVQIIYQENHSPCTRKADGKRVPNVDIVFNFVGEINFLCGTQPERQDS